MAKERDIFIANHHTGAIVLPKVYNPNATGDPAQMQLRLDAIHIPSGGVARISASEWEHRKKSVALQYYLEHGHLEQVRRVGEVDVDTGVTAELEVPEHLRPDDEGNVAVTSAADPAASVKAGVRNAKKGKVQI
jgi:hypothetical protein